MRTVFDILVSLLNDSVNITIGEKESRMMITGLYTVVDIFCVTCGSIVGWKYVRNILESFTCFLVTMLLLL